MENFTNQFAEFTLEGFFFFFFKPEPVSPLTRTSLNVQTKAQLKNISRTLTVESPKHKKHNQIWTKAPLLFLLPTTIYINKTEEGLRLHGG